MPQQEPDLLQVAAGIAAQLREGTAEVMRTEALDADLAGGFGDEQRRWSSRSDSPLPCRLVQGPQQKAVLDLRRLAPEDYP